MAAGRLLWAAPVAALTVSTRQGVSASTSHQAGAGHDQAILTLGIDADLRTVFNWNVKQLFVYVTAEYETVRHTGLEP